MARINILLKISFVIFSGLIAISDIRTNCVPRLAFICAFFIFLPLKFLIYEEQMLIESFIGCMAGLMIFLFTYFITGKKLGLADVWYSALAGMVLGPWKWFAAIGCACLTGIAVILLRKKREIPFIPHMAAGSIIMLFIGG